MAQYWDIQNFCDGTSFDELAKDMGVPTEEVSDRVLTYRTARELEARLREEEDDDGEGAEALFEAWLERCDRALRGRTPQELKEARRVLKWSWDNPRKSMAWVQPNDRGKPPHGMARVQPNDRPALGRHGDGGPCK